MSTATLEQIDPKPFLFNQEQFDQLVKTGWLHLQPVSIHAGAVVENQTARNGHASAPRRWSLAEYAQMTEWGWFEGTRVMLIDGEILTVPMQKSPHYIAIDKTAETLRVAFGAGFWIRCQAPLILEGLSDTEPDVAAASGSRDDYAQEHPRTAALVVEASDSTLRYDRGTKASLYARAGIADYWIVNLVDRQLEVFRNPVADESTPFGFRYDEHRVFQPDEEVTPLSRPQSTVRVADLLP